MPQNFFVTGMPKTGKTSVLAKLVKKLQDSGYKVGGFISPEEKHHGTRMAFHVVDIETGKKAVLASVDGDGPKVSKYHVNISSFERIALPALKKCKKYDVIVIDEIGRMEMKSRKFAALLDDVIESDVPLVVALSRDYLSEYKTEGELFRLTGSNQSAVFSAILKKAMSEIERKAEKRMAPEKPKKKKPAPKKSKKKAEKKEKKAVKKKQKPKKKEKPKKKAKKPEEKAQREPEKKEHEKKEEPPKEEEKAKVHEEAKKKAIKELQEEEEGGKGFFDNVRDLLGF